MDSTATGSSDDGSNATFASFNINKHRDKFVGKNLLALHGINVNTGSTDFLQVAELQTNEHDYQAAIWDLIDERSTSSGRSRLLSFGTATPATATTTLSTSTPGREVHFLPWGTDYLFEKYSRLRVDRRSPRSVRLHGMVARKLPFHPSGKIRRHHEGVDGKHWNEEKLLAETKRIEAMVTPHISDYQWRGIHFEAVREFIRNRRPDVEIEINGEDMPRYCSDVSLFNLTAHPMDGPEESSAMMKSIAKINSRRIRVSISQRGPSPRQTKRRRPSQFQV